MGYMTHRSFAFTEQAHHISDHVHAWLQPGGGFCLSNSALITGGDTSLVVDTLIDIPRTRAMLRAYAEASPAARSIDFLFNTHSHPDHTAGNWVLKDSHVIMTPICADEHRPLEKMIRMMDVLTGDALLLMKELGVPAFSTENVRFVEPKQTFTGELTLDIGGTEVVFVEVGAAHSGSDSIVHVPSDGVVIAGDMLFEGGHPVIGFPSIENWRRALNLMLDWGADTFVPGHGRICGRGEVLRHRQYLDDIEGEIKVRFEQGMTAEEAAFDWFQSLPQRHACLYRADNILRNVTALYSRFSGDPMHHSFADAMASRWRFRERIRGRAPGIFRDHHPDGN